MQITISKAEYDRLTRCAAGVELLSIYFSSEEYPDKKFVRKALNQLLVGMPFSTPEESEDGWHE